MLVLENPAVRLKRHVEMLSDSLEVIMEPNEHPVSPDIVHNTPESLPAVTFLGHNDISCHWMSFSSYLRGEIILNDVSHQ